jgi:hypothetical protein
MVNLNLVARLIAAQKATTPLLKDVNVSGFGGGYKGTSHDSVAAACRDALTANGVLALTSVTASTQREGTFSKGSVAYIVDVEVETTFYNIDDPSESLSVRAIGTGIDAGDKAPGKAMSYAKKYALINALMLSTHENDEERPAEMAAGETPESLVRGLVNDLPDGDARIGWLAWVEKPHGASAWQEALKALTSTEPG